MNKKKNNKKSVQKIPTCIFCDGKPTTKEHLWSQWMRELVFREKTNKHLNTSEILTNTGGVVVQQRPIYKLRTGSTTSIQIKKVCKPCNSGWMGDLEEFAIPILTPLITGEPIVLNIKTQQTVAEWATLKTIVGEYISLYKKVITRSEEKLFYQQKRAPENWLIWIGRSEQKYDYAREHSGENFSFNITTSLGAPVRPVTRRAQATILAVGHLILYIVKPPFRDFEFPGFNFDILGAYGSKFVKIHPQKTTAIHFDKLPLVAHEEYLHLTNNLRNFMINFSRMCR